MNPRSCSIFGLALLLAAAVASAQSPGIAEITEIEVVGNQTVGVRQVLAWAGLEAGRPFTAEAVASALRRLFATGKFSDVYVYAQDVRDGVKLIVNLREFPRIRSVSFAGNKRVKEKDLREAFPVNVGQFANPAAIQRDLQPIRDLYWDKGYYNVQLDTDSTVVDADNMQDLIVTIAEGKKVKVKSIDFVGNQSLSDKSLRKAMKQGTTGFLKSGTFKKQQFEEDKDRIVTHYKNEGYLDASVAEVELNYRDEEKSQLDIVVRVAEGELYRVGDINWDGNAVFDDLAISERIYLTKGGVFREKDYLETISAISQMYADQGYIYINVEPNREIRDYRVNVRLQILEGEPARVHDIKIVGNLKTYDNVILRELRIFPGDTFSSGRIQATQRDIFQLGYFEDVQPDFRPMGDGTDIDLILKVKERQTGQFMFGAAYSAQTSISGFIQVSENNFRGKGQRVAVSWQFGSRRRYLDLSFTEPWLMGTPTLLGVDLFDRFVYNFDDFYESRVRGFSIRTGRRIPRTRYSRVGLRYELSQTRLSNFSTSYVRYLDNLEEQLGTSDLPWQRLDQQPWPQLKSAIRLTLSRNSTDNPFFPTMGSKSMFSFELAGGPLGGEIEYQEYQLSHSIYQRLQGGFTLHLRGFFSLIHGLTEPDIVPDFERYRLGGNRIYPVRGYRDLEIVPRGNPSFIGGRFFTIFNTELLYPLTPSVHLLTFVDVGDTWNSFSETNFAGMRKGAGFGVRVQVPMMGLVGFDYAYGFDRIGGPAWEPHFNIGTFF
jgi:outer membrane protein insertion porin family